MGGEFIRRKSSGWGKQTSQKSSTAKEKNWCEPEQKKKATDKEKWLEKKRNYKPQPVIPYAYLQEQQASQNSEESSPIQEQEPNISLKSDESAIAEKENNVNLKSAGKQLQEDKSVSKAIISLLSYSVFDWQVTASDEIEIITRLKKDSDLSRTIQEINSANMLKALIDRVNKTVNRRELIQLLGAELNSSAKALVKPHIIALGQEWELQFNLGRLGVTSAAPKFNPSSLRSAVVSTDHSAPFTGSGATGVSPTSLSINIIDQGLLAAGDSATKDKYSNPIPGSLPAYLATLSPTQRTQQAELFLRRQISSKMASSYASKIPSRVQIIKAAAKEHKLHPELLAAFFLAEQRDQSRNEDAKDYTAATSLLQGNTSIGLGQVVVSTAKRNDLFADLLSSNTRNDLSHNKIAERLASDDFNIFASARYIRQVANDASKIDIRTLPRTHAIFPNIDMKAYANHSSTWPDDNIRALASEYTSRAWDDGISPGWANFVFEAYKDVIASNIF